MIGTDAGTRAAMNGEYVVMLRRSMTEGGATLANIPGLLKNIIREDRWRGFTTKLSERPVCPPSFEAFVATPPLNGLGTDLRTIRNLIRDDPEAIDLLDRALEHKQGERTDLVDIVNEVELRPDGNSSQQAIRKLRKARPDLLDRVKAGEMSPHAAMIQAGFRKPQITVPADPAKAARRLARHFDADQIRELIAALEHCIPAGMEAAG